MRILVLAACAAAMSACASQPAKTVAAEAAPVSASGPEVAEADGSQRVCRRMEVMGSIRPQRVCATQAEWDAKAEQDQEGVESFDRARRQTGGLGTFE